MKHHFFGRQTWEFPRHKESLEEFGPCETTPKPEFRSSVSIYTGWWLSLPLWKMMEWSPLGWLFHSQLIWTNINFMFQSPPTSVCWFINHYNPHWLTIVIPVISTINHMLMVPVTTNHIYIYIINGLVQGNILQDPPKKKTWENLWFPVKMFPSIWWQMGMGQNPTNDILWPYDWRDKHTLTSCFRVGCQRP